MLSHHFLQICGNWSTPCGVLYKLVITHLSTLYVLAWDLFLLSGA